MAQSTFAVECPACGEQFEQPLSGLDADGEFFCPRCGETMRGDFGPEEQL